MSSSLRSLLVLLAVLTGATGAHAAGKPARRPAAHAVHRAPRHISHTKTIHYRRPAVHRRPVHRATRIVRRPAARKVVRTVHRYPVHRVQRRYVRRTNYFARNYRYHRRYTHSYYSGRYHWRSNYYNRGYGRSRRHLSRGVRGIVEGVQGNAVNGTVLVKVFRPYSRRFRYGAVLAGANRGRGAFAAHRFLVNGATRYEILSLPRQAGTFASLRKGEQVLILRRGNQSNLAQRIELFPPRRR